MTNTTNLGLPFMDANQNQKYVTFNEALLALDALVQIQVQSAALAAPPASPADGQVWIVGAGATGVWAGKDLNLAAWQDGVWNFYAPRPGYIAFNVATSSALMWTGSAWSSLLGVIASLALTAIGIGTAADPSNPLSVTANTALFNALTAAAGGTGDVRLKLNKAAAGNTASFLFQDGFSGRAEIGLTGDDNFHFKTSADGAAFHDAIQISGSGLVSIPVNNFSAGNVNKFRNGTMDVWQRGSAVMTITTAGAYTADGWIVMPAGASCGAQQAAGRQLTAKSLQVYGGTGVTDVVVKQRIESFVAAPLSGQTVTVQAQVYNNTGGAIVPTLTVKHPTAVDNYGSTATDVSAASLQSCPTGQWTQLAYTFQASAASANGVEIDFDFGNNFGSSSKSIQITELDVRVTAGVATGVNTNPPPPELRPIWSETAFCQRYYAFVHVSNRYNASAPQNGDASIYWPVTMRAVPTASLTAGSRQNAAAVLLYSLTIYGARHELTASGSGDTYALDDVVTASAEL